MKIKSMMIWGLMVTLLSISCFQELGWLAWGWFWGVTLGWAYKNQKNHLVSNLLVLEMFSLMNLFVSIVSVGYSGFLVLVFILMSLMVGEAVLGLAILVKTLRSNSKELKLGILI